MSVVASLFTSLAAGLSIWESHDKVRFIEEHRQLKEQFYEEFNKDLADRSDAILDDIQFKLCSLADSFSASVGKQNAPNQ